MARIWPRVPERADFPASRGAALRARRPHGGPALRVFGEQAADHWLFEEQLRLCAAGPPTATQRREVERLNGEAARLPEVTPSILALADELKGETIERLLAKRPISRSA